MDHRPKDKPRLKNEGGEERAVANAGSGEAYEAQLGHAQELNPAPDEVDEDFPEYLPSQRPSRRAR